MKGEIKNMGNDLWRVDPDMDLTENFIIKSDSYKVTHFTQYPKGTSKIISYLEARGCTPKDEQGNDLYSYATWFGEQYVLLRHFCGRQITHYKIDQAKMFFKGHFGVDLMNEAGWRYIVDNYDGYLPLIIRAVDEGTRVPLKNVLMVIENIDPANCGFVTDIVLHWLTNYSETTQSQVWYPTTIATNSCHARDFMTEMHDKTCDTTFVDFGLHDFGFRGVSCYEQACIGGMAHLVAFNGTDTMPAIAMANKVYNAKLFGERHLEIRLLPGGEMNITMYGFSVVATEHSTTTSWGRWGERDCILNLLRSFPNVIKSAVGDSYDVFAFARMLSEDVEIRNLILNDGPNGKFVLRPDSGDPVEINCGTPDNIHRPKNKDEFHDLICMGEKLDGDIILWEDEHYMITGVEEFIREYGNDQWSQCCSAPIDDLISGGRVGILEPVKASTRTKGLIEILWEGFGGHVNNKGYKVLNPKIGLIQGDGIDLLMLRRILIAMEKLRFAASNIVFGSGGGLLQKFDRDTLKFAIKCCIAIINGKEVEVQKDPITGKSKKSKAGRLALMVDEKDNIYTKQHCTIEEEAMGLLKEVYNLGRLTRFHDFEDIRQRARTKFVMNK